MMINNTAPLFLNIPDKKDVRHTKYINTNNISKILEDRYGDSATIFYKSADSKGKETMLQATVKKDELYNLNILG